MAGPWEKYQNAGTSGQGSQNEGPWADFKSSAPQGPWSKYRGGGATADSEPGFFDGSAKSTIDALPMIGGVVGGIAGTPFNAVSGPMGTIVGAGIGGYLGTATKNLINRYYDPASAPKTTAQVITQPIVGGVEQGLMQGTGEAVAPLIGKGVQAVASGAKNMGVKALSNALGANPAAIKEYAQFSKRINSAPSEAALKEISDDFVGKLASDVEAKKLTAEQAQEAYKGFHSDLKDAYKTAGYDARDSVTSAQQTLKDAHNERLQQLSGDVYDTVNKLKGDVQSGSGKALDVLEKSDKMIKLMPVYEELNSQIARAQQAGTKEGQALAQELSDYRANLAESVNRSGKINPVDAKRRIQGLDQTTQYSPMAGSFDKMKNSAYKSIRAAFDQSVKDTVPEYRAAMEPVAKDSDLLSRVSDFGDKQSAAGYLGRINAPTQLERRAALQELGQKYGADFIAGAQPENLPQQAILNKAQAGLESLRPDRVAEKIDGTLGTSRQKATLDAAQSSLSQAQEKLAPFKPLAPNAAGQTMAQQKLAQLGKGGNIELEGMFRELGKLSNTDFVQAMKDQNVLAAFQKGATNGSRNTVFGGFVGYLFGGFGGGAIGMSAGRMVDQYGPAVTKKILDAAIRVSERPSVQTIRALELPEPIKRNMIMGLENYLAKQPQQSGLGMVADTDSKVNRTPAKGESKWAQDGASNLGLSSDEASQLMASPKARSLLIQASDLKPGSPALLRIKAQLKKGISQ